MGQFVESKHNTSLTSPAINRLMKSYKHYVQDQITKKLPILHLTDFYYMSIRNRDFNKSRIYENYLMEISIQPKSEPSEKGI